MPRLAHPAGERGANEERSQHIPVGRLGDRPRPAHLTRHRGAPLAVTAEMGGPRHGRRWPQIDCDPDRHRRQPATPGGGGRQPEPRVTSHSAVTAYPTRPSADVGQPCRRRRRRRRGEIWVLPASSAGFREESWKEMSSPASCRRTRKVTTEEDVSHSRGKW